MFKFQPTTICRKCGELDGNCCKAGEDLAPRSKDDCFPFKSLDVRERTGALSSYVPTNGWGEK